MRNFMLTLLLSQGVPMLQAGDELARTPERQQQRLLPGQRAHLAGLGSRRRPARALLEFTKRVIALRAAEPVFRRRNFFQGRPITGDVKDIYWVSPAGREMQQGDWNDTSVDALGVLLVGDEIDELDDHGQPIVGNSFLVLLNAGRRTASSS